MYMYMFMAASPLAPPPPPDAPPPLDAPPQVGKGSFVRFMNVHTWRRRFCAMLCVCIPSSTSILTDKRHNTHTQSRQDGLRRTLNNLSLVR